jgi:hypothetical protein
LIFDDKSPLRSGKGELILALDSVTGLLKSVLHNILPADQGHMIYDLIATLREQNQAQNKVPAVLDAVATELGLGPKDSVSMLILESWDDMEGEEEYRLGTLGEDPDPS